MGKLYHIGVDLHKKNLQVAVLDNAGEIFDMRWLGNNDKENIISGKPLSIHGP